MYENSILDVAIITLKFPGGYYFTFFELFLQNLRFFNAKSENRAISILEEKTEVYDADSIKKCS